ncbi:EspG family protein [Actinopolyspora xinjiangensis]|uniref:EspG family protein n=1 Tax=Actinopolyspora xinjiangensis TaxID=405564 RepID=A0A1H0UW61_9ACTN|nr:ESX secretion-associated protein EspG [Actinopolyspora xinjiangensis]SDP70407.1 EspG family protein [Actinopolyspora xinjiangensis]
MPSSFTLSTRAADVLCEDLGIDLRRFPFELEYHGGTTEERSRIREAVWRELTDRGLADGREPDQDVEAALRLLHSPKLDIAVTWLETATEEVFRARASVSGNLGVRAVQDSDGLRVGFVDTRSLVRECTDLLPEVSVGTLETATVNTTAASGGGPETDGDSWLTDAEHRPPGRSSDRQLRAAQRILTLPTERIGYFFITGDAADGETPRPPAIGWRDTEDGRYSITARRNNDGADWNTFAPADKQRLAGYLTEQLNALASE